MEPGLTLADIVLLAAVAAIRLSQGLTPQELELLAAFFEVLGDDLALLGLGSAALGDSTGE